MPKIFIFSFVTFQVWTCQAQGNVPEACALQMDWKQRRSPWEGESLWPWCLHLFVSQTWNRPQLIFRNGASQSPSCLVYSVFPLFTKSPLVPRKNDKMGSQSEAFCMAQKYRDELNSCWWNVSVASTLKASFRNPRLFLYIHVCSFFLGLENHSISTSRALSWSFLKHAKPGCRRIHPQGFLYAEI